jgi:hypothetical protein
MNHLELAITWNGTDTIFEVFASEPGPTGTPTRIVRNVRTGEKPPLTRGYVQLQSHSSSEMLTARFDNVGFDGPSVPAGRGYAVADALEMVGMDTIRLGYGGVQDSPILLSVDGVDVTGGTAAHVDLDASCKGDLRFRLGAGAWHDVPCVAQGPIYLGGVPIGLGELQAKNTLTFDTMNGSYAIANIEVVVDP